MSLSTKKLVLLITHTVFLPPDNEGVPKIVGKPLPVFARRVLSDEAISPTLKEIATLASLARNDILLTNLATPDNALPAA